jgi:hypothetical protein
MSTETSFVRGVGRILVAPMSAIVPTRGDITALKDGTFLDYTPIGHTTSAVAVTFSRNRIELTSQQSQATVRVDSDKRDVRVATEAAEHTIANLGLILDGVVTGNDIAVDGSGTLTRYRLAVVGDFWDAEDVLMLGSCASQVADSTISFDSENQTSLAVEFQCLEPQDGENLFDILGPVA